MAKFKKGDRVVNLEEDVFVEKSAIGTVESKNSDCPLIYWDKVKPRAEGDMSWCQHEENLRLFEQPKTPTIEIYKSRGQFTFRVKGANGKKLNHLFQTKQGCKNGILALKKALENYKIVDLTK